MQHSEMDNTISKQYNNRCVRHRYEHGKCIEQMTNYQLTCSRTSYCSINPLSFVVSSMFSSLNVVFF